MKQMPVESFFAQVGMPSRFAIARTSRLSSSPSGNSDRRKLRLRQAVQEVALVLGPVDRLQQLTKPRSTSRTRA